MCVRTCVCMCLLIHFCMCYNESEQDLVCVPIFLFIIIILCRFAPTTLFVNIIFACCEGKMRTLISVTAQPLVCSPASQAVCTKQDESDGNCNTITNDKSHPVDFKLSSFTHAHTSTYTDAHLRAFTEGCGSYQDFLKVNADWINGQRLCSWIQIH